MSVARHITSLTLAAALALSAARAGRAQSFTLEDLRAPGSPAFVLMGIEPQSIERPRTPRAFGLSILQASEQLTALPRNYAVEFAPFWLVPHPALEFRPYERASIGATMLQTLGVSLATATDSGATRTSMGLGVRTQLARGSMSDSATLLLDSLRALQRAILFAGDTASENALAAEASKIALAVQRNLYVTGWRVELAGAVTAVFDSSRFESGRFSRLGLWLTASYQAPRPRLDMAGLMRLVINGADRTGALFDYGTRISYVSHKVMFGTELLGRTSIDATITSAGPGPSTGTFAIRNTWRAAGMLEYSFAPGTSLLFTFGRNFTEAGVTRNLIASAAINLGAGAIPLVASKPRQ